MTSANRPTEPMPVTMLSGSGMPTACSSWDSTSTLRPSTNAAKPIGTLTKKADRQPTQSIRAPPITGPAAAASDVIEAKIPSAVDRFSAGYSGSSRAMAAGTSSAPPTACTIRAPINRPSVGAAPTTPTPADEDQESQGVDPASTVPIGQAPGRQQHRCEHDAVRRPHPRHRRRRGVELLLQGVAGDVDDGGIERRHRRTDHRDRQDLAAS